MRFPNYYRENYIAGLSGPAVDAGLAVIGGLGCVHELVGLLDQLILTEVGIFLRGGDAVGDRQQIQCLPAPAVSDFVELLGDDRQRLVKRIQYHRKFVSADAVAGTIFGEDLPDAGGGAADQFVTGLVPQSVVDPLQLVHIQHNNARGLFLAAQHVQPVVVAAAVIEAGQLVGLDQVLVQMVAPEF